MISDLADVTLGKTPRRTDYASDGLHRVIKYRDIRDNELVLDETKDGFARDDPELLHSLREVLIGDILIGASGHSSESIGRKVAIVRELPSGGPHYFAGELLRIRPDRERLDGRWIQRFFASERGFQTLQDAVSGVHLTNGRARQMRIPLPPLAEQRELCDLLDAMFGASSSAHVHFASARRAIERFRRAVLKAACSGRLTGRWRLAQSSRVADDDEGPTGWRLPRLSEIAERVTKGTTPTSYGHSFLESGVAFVKVENIANGRVDRSSIRSFISEETHKAQARSMLEAGDVLFSIAGTIGRTAIVEPDDLPANTNQALAVIRGTGHLVRPDYLVIALRSAVQQAASTAARGSGMSNISLADVKKFEVPVPPLQEQIEIVRHVEELSTLAENLLSRVDGASRRMDRSAQSILAEVFRDGF